MRAVGGIVLCGGRSARMGSDKALLPFGGDPMWLRTVRVVAGEVDPVVVVSSAGQVLSPVMDGVERAVDRLPDRGPLEGLATGLSRVADRCEAAFVVGCDYPYLTSGFVQWMAGRWRGEEALVVRRDGHVCPLPGVYRTRLVDAADALLAGGRCSLMGLLESVDCTIVDAGELAAVDGGSSNLDNINTPTDYENALRRRRDAGGE